MLDAADVAGYLLDQGLLGPRAIVDGGLRIDDRSGLNRVFVATATGERCLVLKTGPGVAREAAVLERLRLADASGGLTASLPAIVAHDRAERVLVLESPPGGRDLTVHHAHGRFSRALACATGRALARLHALPLSALEGLGPAPHPRWDTQLHRPDLETLHTLSTAAVELTRELQGSGELCDSLDELLGSWRAGSVIHGDVRWGNCLALRGASSRWTRLQLIDWELCGAGDPAFDVGAFLGEYLGAWLRSIPIANPRDAGRLRAHARLPLRRMRPALGAFWDAYARQSGAGEAELRATLQTATRFAAVRVLMAALEEAQALPELRPDLHALLPLSANVLRRPGEAAGMLGLAAPAATG